MIKKIWKIITILLVIYIICWGLSNPNEGITILECVIVIIIMMWVTSLCQDSLSILFTDTYVSVVLVFQFIYEYSNPNLFSKFWISANELRNQTYRNKFYIIMLISYIFMAIGIIINEKFTISISIKKIHFWGLKARMKVNPILMSVAFAIVDTVIKYFIGYGVGRTVTIPFSGVVVYCLEAISICLSIYALDYLQDVSDLRKKIICLLVISMFLSMGNSIWGSRAAAIFTFIKLLLAIGIWNNKEVKRIIPIMPIIFIIFMLIATAVTKWNRGGQLIWSHFVVNRFTGYFDGIKAIELIESGEFQLTLLDFLKRSLLGKGMSVSLFYTEWIGYNNKIMGEALPGATSAVLYGGISLLIIWSIAMGYILRIIERKILMASDNESRFIYAYAYLFIITTMIMGGLIDDIRTLFVPLIIYLLLSRIVGFRYERNREK